MNVITIDNIAAAFIYLLNFIGFNVVFIGFIAVIWLRRHDNEPKAHWDCVGVGYEVGTCVDVTYRSLPYSAICLSIHEICTALLWSTDAKTTHPFKPRQRRSFKSCVIAILLLLNIDVESNSGPAPEAMRIGHINTWSCVNNTKHTLKLLNAIVEQRVDVLVMAESFIKDQCQGHSPFQS